MDIERVKVILSELFEISKDFKVGNPMKKFKIKSTELKNFDLEQFSELEKIEDVLFSKKDTFTNYEKVLYVPLIELENDLITFYPSVIKRYKEKLK